MKKRVATYSEKRQMEALMMTNSEVVNKDALEETRNFTDGWDFDVVAKKVSPTLASHHAKAVADAMGWVFIKPRKITLEERVMRLENQLATLISDFYK